MTKEYEIPFIMQLIHEWDYDSTVLMSLTEPEAFFSHKVVSRELHAISSSSRKWSYLQISVNTSDLTK
jgi:hypothetical protein